MNLINIVNSLKRIRITYRITASTSNDTKSKKVGQPTTSTSIEKVDKNVPTTRIVNTYILRTDEEIYHNILCAAYFQIIQK